jgi:hypothetical protein
MEGIGWLKLLVISMIFPFSNVIIATNEENGKRKIVGVVSFVNCVSTFPSILLASLIYNRVHGNLQGIPVPQQIL